MLLDPRYVLENKVVYNSHYVRPLVLSCFFPLCTSTSVGLDVSVGNFCAAYYLFFVIWKGNHQKTWLIPSLFLNWKIGQKTALWNICLAHHQVQSVRALLAVGSRREDVNFAIYYGVATRRTSTCSFCRRCRDRTRKFILTKSVDKRRTETIPTSPSAWWKQTRCCNGGTHRNSNLCN